MGTGEYADELVGEWAGRLTAELPTLQLLWRTLTFAEPPGRFLKCAQVFKFSKRVLLCTASSVHEEGGVCAHVHLSAFAVLGSSQVAFLGLCPSEL